MLRVSAPLVQIVRKRPTTPTGLVRQATLRRNVLWYHEYTTGYFAPRATAALVYATRVVVYSVQVSDQYYYAFACVWF